MHFVINNVISCRVQVVRLAAAVHHNTLKTHVNLLQPSGYFMYHKI